MMKKAPIKWMLFTLTACSFTACCHSNNAQKEMDRFIDHLMNHMTLEEKLGQLNMPLIGGTVSTGNAKASNIAPKIMAGQVGGLFNVQGVDRIRELQQLAVEDTRLGIPLLFCMDVIHGHKTIYPLPLALSCSWDMPGIEQSARVAAIECSSEGIALTFSPMVDICCDARWGRIAEGSGEDPYLGSQIASAMVRGYQGKNLSDSTTIMACFKHFGMYGAPEGGREYNTVDMSPYRMYNDYLPPYKAATEAGAGSAMCAFNTINGVPATCNRWLLTDLLRKQWGFDGFVITDYTTIEELMNHGVCSTLQEASAMALQAGVDVDLVSEGFSGTLPQSLMEKRVSQKDIDKACRRVLEAKYKLGLFDDPYRYCDSTRHKTDILKPAFRAHARQMAQESMVLLKNDNQLLPLRKQGTIALIGPMIDNRPNMSGTWSVAAVFDQYKNIHEGLAEALQGKAQLLTAKGSNVMYDAQMEERVTPYWLQRQLRDSRSAEEMRREAVAIAKHSDVIIAVLGECAEMSGECASMVNLEMPDAQHDLLVELTKLGKPIVLVHFSGRPTVLNWETEHIPAILEAWFPGSETADALADVLFGEVSPSGKLTTSFPRHVGQLPMSYRQFNTTRPTIDDDFVKFLSCYVDVKNSPLYPFGYGLSYTTFDYSPVTLSDSVLCGQDSITATVTVANTGRYDADEIVQLYIRDEVSMPARPLLELRGFQRVHIAKGESVSVTFTLSANDLGFYQPDGTWTCDSGYFQIMAGPNSRQLQSRRLRYSLQ